MRLTIVGGFFLPVPPLRGGATEKIWHRLAAEFAAAGHEVTFVSRQWPGLPAAESARGVRHLRIPGADHSRRLAVNLWRDWRWGRRAAAILPAGDAVICNTVSLPAWLPRRRPGAGAVAVVLGRVPKGQLRFYGGVRRFYATSQAVAEQARAQRPAIAPRLKVIWNPIDWTLHARARAQHNPPVTIGFVGRVHPEKGIALLLEAAARLRDRVLPEWRIRLIGPSDIPSGGGGEDWVGRVRKDWPEAGEVVSFEGPEFDPAVLARHYGRMDIFCYPSLAEKGETFGVAAAEAMAAGAVPVVSALECFRDFVVPEISGLVFDHRGPGAAGRLADALALLIGDPGRRRQLAAAAAEAVARFDYPVVAKNILDDLDLLTKVGRE